MFVKGKLIDILERTISPKKGQTFAEFKQLQLFVKESPDRNPEKVTCDPKDFPEVKIGSSVDLPVYVRHFATGYELKHSTAK